MSAVKEWPSILLKLEEILSTATVKTWFYKSDAFREAESHFEVFFPNVFALERVRSHYLTNLKETLESFFGLPQAFLKLSVRKIATKPLGPLFLAIEDSGENQVSSGNRPVMTEENPEETPGKTWQPPRPSLKTIAFGLSPFFSLSEFIVGPGNQLAFTVASNIAHNPGQSYNPFFLYAPTGLGKTHLIQALGNEILNRFPQMKVVYSTGEAFTNELLESIQHRGQKRFRDKFRQTDVLLIDDVQFIAGKEATQEEFFHAFNDLYLAQKQIVLTSDRPPREIALLEDRLRSRFAGGMIADMTPPDQTLRTAILRTKRDKAGFDIGNEVIDFIAAEVKTNIREMEGVFLQVASVAKAKNVPADLTLATAIISQNSLLTGKEKPTPKRIIEETCQLFNLSHKDLIGHRRTKELVLPRQICMYLLRSLSRLPLMAVAELLGHRDHTTIMHGVDKIENLLKEGGEISQKVSFLTLKVCG